MNTNTKITITIIISQSICPYSASAPALHLIADSSIEPHQLEQFSQNSYRMLNYR